MVYIREGGLSGYIHAREREHRYLQTVGGFGIEADGHDLLFARGLGKQRRFSEIFETRARAR